MTSSHIWMSSVCMDIRDRERAYPAAAESAPTFLHVQLGSANIVTGAFIGY